MLQLESGRPIRGAVMAIGNVVDCGAGVYCDCERYNSTVRKYVKGRFLSSSPLWVLRVGHNRWLRRI